MPRTKDNRALNSVPQSSVREQRTIKRVSTILSSTPYFIITYYDEVEEDAKTNQARVNATGAEAQAVLLAGDRHELIRLTAKQQS